MVRALRRCRLLVFGVGLLAILWSPATAAFANVAVGAEVENASLPRLEGGTQEYLARGKVSVFVFFRPTQEHSLDVLRRMAEIEGEFADRPVHFAALVSDADSREAVRSAVLDSGVRMPVLVDVGDGVYGRLGVRLHPVVGVVDARQRLAAFQPFEKINFGELVRARIRQALGEIGEAEVARVLEPARATMPGDDQRAIAKRSVTLGRMLLAGQKWEKALESARRAQQADGSFSAARTLAGQALAGLKRCPEAVAEFEAALKLDAADAEAEKGLQGCR